MYTLHIANKNYSSWSLRPWLLMTAQSIPFREQIHPFDGQDNSARFGVFSPSGRVPCLVDGDVAVWDSLAIIEYLAERHAGVWPSDPVARAWARCAAAEMHSSFFALRNDCNMNCALRVELNGQREALRAISAASRSCGTRGCCASAAISSLEISLAPSTPSTRRSRSGP